MAETTAKLRELWKAFECDESKMVVVRFGPGSIRVAPATAPAWDALAAVIQHHGYRIRAAETHSYNCRTIKSGTGKSLHSYGIAIDVNAPANPFRETPDKRKVRFSDRASQAERAEDVHLHRADTDMTRAMIDDALRIATVKGKRVLEWGGSWSTVKDAMHFEIDLSPDDLAEGIDHATVAGWPEFLAGTAASAAAPTPAGMAPAAFAATARASADRRVVIARDGLRLRGGPSTDFQVLRTLPEGTTVDVLTVTGDWAQVDLEGDGLADGFVSAAFLRSAGTPAPIAGGGRGPDMLDRITVDMVAAMFPATRKASIAANLPFVLDGLRACGLTDRSMALMALATIRAETEGFVPISEGQSRFNTERTPFDLYDAGTSKGNDLGNTVPGDGPRFKGRGFVQLTGRSNYTRIGRQLGLDLAGQPDLANDPAAAGRILAQFLANKETAIRAALAADDLRTARRLINGGSHGFDRFENAHELGLGVVPA